MTVNDLEHYNRGFYGFYICSQWAFIHALLSRVPFALAGLSCFLCALTMFDFDFCNALPVRARVGRGTITAIYYYYYYYYYYYSS